MIGQRFRFRAAALAVAVLATGVAHAHAAFRGYFTTNNSSRPEIHYGLERKDAAAAWPASPTPLITGPAVFVSKVVREGGAARVTIATRDASTNVDFFQESDQGKELVAGSGATQIRAVIATYKNPRLVVLGLINPITTPTAPLAITLETDRRYLDDETVTPGSYTYRIYAFNSNAPSLRSGYTNDFTKHISPFSPGELIEGEFGAMSNVSNRAFVDEGERVAIAGFILREPRHVLIRGVGPALQSHGVAEFLADPVLRLYRKGVELAVNDDWGTADAAMVAAATDAAGTWQFPPGSADAAMVIPLQPGEYTAILASATPGGRGIGLAEVYELR